MDRQRDVHSRSLKAWMVLRFVLVIEVIGGAVVLWNVVQAFIAASQEPLGMRMSLLLAVLIAWIWVIITLFGAAKYRASWARGSAITIHVLMFAAATGILQGILGEAQGLGWGLVLLSFVGFFSAILARPEVAEVDEVPEA